MWLFLIVKHPKKYYNNDINLVDVIYILKTMLFMKRFRWFKYLYLFLLLNLLGFGLWQYYLTAPMNGDWQPHIAIMPTAEIHDNLVEITNVRNFRYSAEEDASVVNYYNQSYDLDKLSRIWYINEPFTETKSAAHTFLSFEFSDGKYLTISIEARKLKGQDYDIVKGLFRTYPLMYIVADERDTIMVRANVRKNNVYLYPVKTTPAKARLVLIDMLETMNDLAIHPRWYNTLTANCTSLIAHHVNRVTPHKLPFWSWQLLLTGHADELALEAGLLDTDLDINSARDKYRITERSIEIGDVENYSQLIREGIR